MDDTILENTEYEDSLDSSWSPKDEPGYKELVKVNMEDCYQISAGSFGRGVLKPQGTSISDLATTTIGKSGVTYAWSKWNALPLEFEITLGEEFKVFIQYKTKNGQYSQEIYIATKPATYGPKPYLQCSCGYIGKLYLRPGSYYWYCYKCCNLIYELQTINKRTVSGLLAYYLNRKFKIKDARAMISREVYNGKLTRKVKRVIVMSKKWRISPEVKAKIESKLPK